MFGIVLEGKKLCLVSKEIQYFLSLICVVPEMPGSDFKTQLGIRSQFKP